jgi:RNA polymerase sigma-70 factor (ECF subfamily)
MKSLELIERIRSNEDARNAQDALYRNTEAAILNHLRQRIPARLRSRIDAEDVLHEAFLRAMAALDGFRANSESSFFAWVYTIAKNLISDVADRRSAMALPLGAGEDGESVSPSHIPARGRRVSTEFSRREWIVTVLRRLKEKEAEVIRLRLLMGMSFEEIAARWNRTPGAVQRFYSRARQRFRELAQEYQE